MTWSDDIAIYLKPVPDVCIHQSRESAQLISYIDIHSTGHFPDLDQVKFALLGVEEGRRSISYATSYGPNEIRKKLYRLFYHGNQIKVVDLGNISAGETPADTDYAVQKVVSELITRNICVVILGGSQEITFAQYAAYEYLETTVNLGVIDAVVDMGEFRESLSPDNYLSKIVIHEPSYLFNMSHMGYQTYLNNPEVLSLLDKLYFDAHRLGEIVGDMRVTEPYIRNSDLLSVDINVVRNASAQGTGQPNGLSGEEICQMMKYAGMSDKTTSIGIFNYDPETDSLGQTALLIAEMVWCILDGFSNRQKEFPLMSKKDFIEYKVHMPNRSDELVFYKSKRSDKWWMNVPYAGGAQGILGRHHLVPCSYADYTLACAGEVPDIWWRTYQKLG